MYKNQVLFYTNYYKQCCYFDDTLLRIAREGYPIVVLLNGEMGEFQSPRITHPKIQIIQAHRNSYDGGMVTFKQNNLLLGDPQTEYLVHLDCDCYLSDTQELKEYLDCFEEAEYGYCSHLCNEATSKLYRCDKPICQVHDQQIFQRDPGGPPTPEPHYENAYQIIRRKYYEPLSLQQVGHHRLFIEGVFHQGAKMGAHYADYIHNYSSYGREWFHLGHIMEKYLVLERNESLTRYNTESAFDSMRAGFFAAQEDCYGSGIYSDFFRNRLGQFYQHMGGRDKVLASWNQWTKGTCMENWKAL